jgi:hypothetical protein
VHYQPFSQKLGGNSCKKLFSQLLFAVLLSTIGSPTMFAQSPKPIGPADLNSLLHDIKQADYRATDQDEVIDGTRVFNGWFFKARKLTFKKGATLVFSKQAWTSRGVLFIVAKQIESEDAGDPGTITWERDPQGSPAQSAGQAATGAFPGGGGAAGAEGTTGSSGESAPSITIAVLAVAGSGPKIDLEGQQGGQGGQGQKGGSGGAGAGGGSASQNAFNCNHGAENGHVGGPGGTGGVGGRGGRGGAGGTFSLISTNQNLPGLMTRFRVLFSGGQPGAGGSGGQGGDGGPGGPGGAQQLPYCRGDGSPGPTGSRGADGTAWSPSPDDLRLLKGRDGDFLTGGTSVADFNTYIWGGGNN